MQPDTDTKRTRRIYWTATGLVVGVMAYSAVNFNLKNPLGPMKGAFAHLLLPDYFRIELTVAKALGVLALLLPRVPSKVREFAYFGFAITLISAAIAHFSVGDPVVFVLDPLLFLGALVTSYVYFFKLDRREPDRARREGGPDGLAAPPLAAPAMRRSA